MNSESKVRTARPFAPQRISGKPPSPVTSIDPSGKKVFMSKALILKVEKVGPEVTKKTRPTKPSDTKVPELPPVNVPTNVLVSGLMTCDDPVKISPLLN